MLNAARRTSRIGRSLAFVAVLGMSMAVFAQPKLTQEQEWKAHPKLTNAVKSMEGAIDGLDKAPHDFGGNRAKAVADLKTATHSLKKAILYRLKMDDAALDAANPGK
jgi:hypothetical protein